MAITNHPIVDYSLYGGAESPPTSTVVSSASEGSADESDGSNQLRQRNGQRRPSHNGQDVVDEHTKLYGLDRTDFLWTMTEEPHRSRRLQILKAHPEIKTLMGHSKLTKYLVLSVVLLQVTCAALLRNTHPLSWKFLLTAYAIGGTCNQNLFLAIHEITHNLAFQSILPNRLLAMVANLGIGIPYSVVFKKYHLEHHKRMGEDGIDTDVPCKFEAMFLNNVAGKTFFAIFQILFYALRPGFVRSQGQFTRYHALNYAVVIAFNATLVYATGSWFSLVYLLMSSFLAGSLHPLAGHFIAEHYVWEEGNEQETYSYYGILNFFAYNVGYHNEHHDFPNVPWHNLPQVKAMAPEFYQEDQLKSHASWPYVTYRFITDPKVGMFSRVKRENKGD